MTVYPFIEAEKVAGHGVERPCSLLEVSRSAYYEWKSNEGKATAHDAADATMSTRIAEIHRQSRGTYGAPRVLAQLRREGVASSKKRVARLMAAQGLVGRQRRRTKKTTEADPRAEGLQVDLLKREFSPRDREPDQVWVGDISYLRTREGWCYLATVIDVASRRVVGHALADHMKTELVSDALAMAVGQRRPAPGLIFHSDRGSQYTSRAYREQLASHGIRQSLSRPRQCWDNAVAESFFATLKEELVYRQSLQTKAAVRAAIFEYVEVFYNRQRLHSTLGYRSPVEYEEQRRLVAAPAAA